MIENLKIKNYVSNTSTYAANSAVNTQTYSSYFILILLIVVLSDVMNNSVQL